MRSLLFAAMCLYATVSALAQPDDSRRVELSLSATFQSMKLDPDQESSDALLLLPRVGVFVVEGLEIEPEILFMSRSRYVPLYALNGNISYNFLKLDKSVPFVLAGYGVANSIPYFHVPYFETPFTVGVLNLGGGLKAFIRENIAIRVEYRYQRYQGEEQRDGFLPFSRPYTQKVEVVMHLAQFGLSVLL
jgi:hypothetical protein